MGLSRSSGAATPDTLSPSAKRGPDAFPLLTLLTKYIVERVGFNVAEKFVPSLQDFYSSSHVYLGSMRGSLLAVCAAN